MRGMSDTPCRPRGRRKANLAKAQAEAGPGPAGAGPTPGAEAKEKDMGNVVDAEFTEVKDKKA